MTSEEALSQLKKLCDRLDEWIVSINNPAKFIELDMVAIVAEIKKRKEIEIINGE